MPADPITLDRTVRAFNTATDSENRIHDDATASRFGFTGGLVPGVDVFAYMQHAPMKCWGRDWLAGGAMQARFLRPVYDGDAASVSAEGDEDSLRLSLSSLGALCAVGEAHRLAPARAFDIPPRGVQPPQDQRPKASMASLPVGLEMGYPLETYTAEEGREHLDMVREDAALFENGALCNPAYLLRRANYILATNVELGPWIHTESDIALHRLVRAGEEIDIRARVTDNVEHKGHLIVTLAIAALADGEPAMTGRHVAIYEPRQVREG
ncbi:MAG: hypothetical protein R3C52_06465 [Hyphomonadaceae bacterium]